MERCLRQELTSMVTEGVNLKLRVSLAPVEAQTAALWTLTAMRTGSMLGHRMTRRSSFLKAECHSSNSYLIDER